MIQRWRNEAWDGVEPKPYKDNPGFWESVTRFNLMPDAETAFQIRCFEVEPGGYTSFEKHNHEHCVVVLSGTGQVRLGNDLFEIAPQDAVHVPGMTPHQFQNTGDEPLRILCVVDKERDRPMLLDSEGNVCASEPQRC
ncbi:MAG: S-methyl-thioxylulose 5-phosphate methylthiotransferase [Fimbriimonadaceae bacterium]|nr:S-methyl-thioxylulose 5-phosphate methylthiotransferase [Fimbriimonadaceae bacterium]